MQDFDLRKYIAENKLHEDLPEKDFQAVDQISNDLKDKAAQFATIDTVEEFLDLMGEIIDLVGAQSPDFIKSSRFITAITKLYNSRKDIQSDEPTNTSDKKTRPMTPDEKEAQQALDTILQEDLNEGKFASLLGSGLILISSLGGVGYLAKKGVDKVVAYNQEQSDKAEARTTYRDSVLTPAANKLMDDNEWLSLGGEINTQTKAISVNPDIDSKYAEMALIKYAKDFMKTTPQHIAVDYTNGQLVYAPNAYKYEVSK